MKYSTGIGSDYTTAKGIFDLEWYFGNVLRFRLNKHRNLRFYQKLYRCYSLLIIVADSLLIMNQRRVFHSCGAQFVRASTSIKKAWKYPRLSPLWRLLDFLEIRGFYILPHTWADVLRRQIHILSIFTCSAVEPIAFNVIWMSSVEVPWKWC